MSVTSNNLVNFCRYCLLGSSSGNNLISACNCKGSLKFVHLSCLERWIYESLNLSCELCGSRYNIINMGRLNFCNSLKFWLIHSRNKTQIQIDVFIAFLLTLATVGLCLVCYIGEKHFIQEGEQWGISRTCIVTTIYTVVAVVLGGYLASLFLLGRPHVILWYNWWKSKSCNIIY